LASVWVVSLYLARFPILLFPTILYIHPEDI
jgi:hypothetical protein